MRLICTQFATFEFLGILKPRYGPEREGGLRQQGVLEREIYRRGPLRMDQQRLRETAQRHFRQGSKHNMTSTLELPQKVN